MSVLAACLHKAEWVCDRCAKCSSCCVCTEGSGADYVHINSKEAAIALARHAREMRDRKPS